MAAQVVFNDDDPLRGLAELVGGKFEEKVTEICVDDTPFSREDSINFAYEILADAYPDLVKLTPDPDLAPAEEATDGEDV